MEMRVRHVLGYSSERKLPIQASIILYSWACIILYLFICTILNYLYTKLQLQKENSNTIFVQMEGLKSQNNALNEGNLMVVNS